MLRISLVKILQPYLKAIVSANYKDSLQESNLPDEIKRAVIMWKGRFHENDYSYMKEYIENVVQEH